MNRHQTLFIRESPRASLDYIVHKDTMIVHVRSNRKLHFQCLAWSILDIKCEHQFTSV